jgi:CheY-like chemotaxis protein
MEGIMFTVLIVDNDSSFRKVLCTLLEQGGFDSCIEARSGTEAIEKSRHLLPNLVILDFSLPGMNGLQLAQELREILPRLPIFMPTQA